MKLSICIATLESREDLFNALRAHLLKQACALGYTHATALENAWVLGGGESYPVVEILWDRDGGAKAVGKKRQDMLQRATGDYVVAIDDDDTVSDQYLSDILFAIEDDPDCIGFDIDCYGYAPDNKLETARVSNRYQDWLTDVDGFRYVRCPHHLVPVLREHALKAGFEDLTYREDSGYSFRLRDLGLLKNEAFIPKVLYTIWHNRDKTKGA